MDPGSFYYIYFSNETNNLLTKGFIMATTNIINTLATSLGQTPTVSSIDDEIKVLAKVLDAFQGSELRGKVSDEVDATTIAQAQTIVEKLPQLNDAQKVQVRNHLKAMIDEAERQLMTLLISNSAACPNATSLDELLHFDPTAAAEEEDFKTEDEPQQTSVDVNSASPVGNLVQMIAGLLQNIDMNRVRQMLNS